MVGSDLTLPLVDKPGPEHITARQATELMGNVAAVTARENLRRWKIKPVAIVKVRRGYEQLYDLEAVIWAVQNRPGRQYWPRKERAKP